MRWWLMFAPLIILSASMAGTDQPTNRIGIMVLSVASLFGSRTQTIAAGFLLGIMEAALVGSNAGAFVITRVLIAFAMGSVRTLEFDANFLLAGVWSFAATLVTQLVFGLGVPGSGLLAETLATLSSALLNAALAMILYGLVSRLVAGRS
jgi:hypothetical protein